MKALKELTEQRPQDGKKEVVGRTKNKAPKNGKGKGKASENNEGSAHEGDMGVAGEENKNKKGKKLFKYAKFR